jgi:hypothetical protein
MTDGVASGFMNLFSGSHLFLFCPIAFNVDGSYTPHQLEIEMKRSVLAIK